MINRIKNMVKTMFPLGYNDEFLLLIKMAIPLVGSFKKIIKIKIYFKCLFITMNMFILEDNW